LDKGISKNKGMKMSCTFNLKNCVNCPKYNGCLLQLLYKNTIGLTDMLKIITNNQEQLLTAINKIPVLMANDNVEILSNIDSLSSDVKDISTILTDDEKD
jgi:ACT domain-containing protein